jgi:hypothetical protein
MDVLLILKSALIQIVSSTIRSLLVAGLIWLQTKNLIDQPTAMQLSGIIPIVIAGIIWSLIEKYILERFKLNQLLKALSLPAGSTLADLKGEKKDGNIQ